LKKGKSSLHSFNYLLLPNAFYLCCAETVVSPEILPDDSESDLVWGSEVDENSAHNNSMGRDSFLSTFEALNTHKRLLKKQVYNDTSKLKRKKRHSQRVTHNNSSTYNPAGMEQTTSGLPVGLPSLWNQKDKKNK